MLRVLMVDITNGAVQDLSSSSRAGLFLGGCREGCLDTGIGPARERPLHGADAALDAMRRRTENLLRLFLTEEYAELEGQRVEAAGEHDPGAALLRICLMGVDHLPHPDRLTAEIDIIRARGRAGREQLRAVELIGTDGRYHEPRLRDHRLQRGDIA